MNDNLFVLTSFYVLIKPHCWYLNTGTTHLVMTVVNRMNLFTVSPGPIFLVLNMTVGVILDISCRVVTWNEVSDKTV